MGTLGWAVAFSVLSAASYAAAAIAQERLAEHGQRGWSRWATALLLTGGGVVLHVVALNFGTVAVVQALGTLTLLFALPIAAVRYGTRVGRAAWVDAILTVVGLALILSLSVESSEPRVLGQPDDRYLALITLAVVAVLVLGAWASGPRVRSVLLAAAAGVAFGISSVLSKAVLAAFTAGGVGAVSPFAGVAVLVFATGGYVLSQLSYGRAGMAAPLATVSVANPIVAAIAGVVVFGEGFRFGPSGLAVVAFAATVMTVGVIGLARRAAAESPSDGRADSATRTDIAT
ncbi:DMT family transporter [Actinoplanes bogorensis]|uniref:DMT family transporter n=1 Tax=Paractinoplanes bogorensis TaxID=1610840 RepID=A0ABS5Z1F5_9ACTN|nr:DMT family transporter [Actinoplanes bogorensis]MBU2669523.1 DMT family transporter [Actinoplanes bogorensis]